MTLILVDGCEDLSSWTASGSVATVASNPRSAASGRSFQTNSGQSASSDLAVADQTDTLTVGVAFTTTSLSATTDIISFRSDAGATAHVTLGFNATTGVLVVYRGLATSGGTLLGTSTGAIVANSWTYLEFQAKLSDTVGTVTVKQNGVTILSLTGLDTKNGGTKTVFDQVRLMPPAVGSSNYDDLWITNDTTFLGNCYVETLYPNGNGAANQWVGSDGDSVNNYLLVDENVTTTPYTPDTSDYVSTPTAGQQDLYTMTDLSAANTRAVLAVCHHTYAARTDSSARQVKLLNRGSATNASPGRDVTTAFAGYTWALTTNPETGVAWTIAQVNALQSGVEAV